MTQYLLAAEADKIQDLIFRAVKLREVVGGSQLLSRFGDELDRDDDQDKTALQLLIEQASSPPQIITAGGGSFRLLFDEAGQARQFGAKLAELYRLTTGGAMSVARPVPHTGNYDEANKKADAALRQAKISGGMGQVTPQLPYTAFCASCGTALATEHQDGYLCGDCLNKSAERRYTHTRSDRFLTPFYETVAADLSLANYRTLDQAGDLTDEDPTELLAGLDPRRYVAYLLADGNGMGKLFGKCSQEQATQLSRRLTGILRTALAHPTGILMQNQPEFNEEETLLLPALPLILSGDDLFALVPARWSLDFAQHFCMAYEQEMQTTLAELELSIDPPPTISAAVVICKVNYPYYLAHQVGETRLKEAKRLAKRLQLETKAASSVVNFEIITGSQAPQSESNPASGQVRDTLRPYWIANDIPAQWGLPLDTLLEQRVTLQALPRRRRAQLRYFFDELSELNEPEANQKKPKLEQLKSRVARSPDDEKNLHIALAALGNPDDGWLREVETNTARWQAHGLPDLLDAWEFSQKIDNGTQEEVE